MPAITVPKTGNTSLDLYTSRLKSELDPLIANKLVQGNLLQNVAIVSGQNQIQHKLQRLPYGSFIVYQSTVGSFYNYQASDKNNLYLTASGSFTASLWVF